MSVGRMDGNVVGNGLQTDGVTFIITIACNQAQGGQFVFSTTNPAFAALFTVGSNIFLNAAGATDQAAIAAAVTIVTDGTEG